LTPTRYLWSGYNDYFKSSIFKLISKPPVSYLRFWDKIASQRPDHYISISGEVQNRIKKYYKKDSEIIYPPLMMSKKVEKDSSSGEYFLVVSRLTNFYKRVDIVIKACNQLKLPLKIVGIGRDENSLKKMAGPTVEFLGRLTDDELWSCYKNCKAVIFPGLEDFGLTMVEAQAFGKPVIAFRGGGALDIVQEGKTGKFFNEQNPESLMAVLKSFDEKRYNMKSCRENSEKFSFERFEENLRKFLESKI